MADPTKYQRSYSFSGYQATNPRQPLPGPRVDDELENIEASIDDIVDALKEVRRSDGGLKNGVVTVDSLAPGLLLVITGLVQTLYDQAASALVTLAGYVAAAQTALVDTLLARDEAREAASDAAVSAIMLNAYIYDFNLGGTVADPDWNA